MPATQRFVNEVCMAFELGDGSWERIDCPVCGAAQFDHLFVAAGEPFTRCCCCKLVLINPRRSGSMLAATYDGAYSHRYIAKASKKRRRAARWVTRLQHSFGVKGRWLDVGCSAGFIVEAAQSHGFEAYGVELEPQAVTFAQRELGLSRVSQGSLEAQHYADCFFDVISVYDVIEHIPALNASVRELYRVAKPGGLVEIRTPDLGHWRTPHELARWREIKPSEHLYYFDHKTLARLFEKHGFALHQRRFMFKPALDMVFLRP